MRFKPTLALAISLLLAPVTVLALGLGEIEPRSALNERFNARIELVSATPEELESLEVALATPAAFERYDLPLTAELRSLRFEVVNEGGQAYVQVTSQNVIREPFLTFLVEADWANGRLLREYTVLLDPPVFDEQAEAAPARAPAAAPATGATQPEEPAPRRTETVTRGTVAQMPAGEPEAAPADTAQGYPDREPYTAPAGTYGRIRRGETLSQIAMQLKPSDVSLNQMMIALYRANPEAFLDNINLIKQGSVLRVPDMADVRAIARQDANRIVRQQTAAWRGETTGGDAGEASLSLVAPGEEAAAESGGGETPAAAGAGAGASDERFAELQSELSAARDALAESRGNNEALRERVAELEKEIAEVRSLLSLKDNQLLALQQQAGAATGAETPQAATQAATEEQPAGQQTPDETGMAAETGTAAQTADETATTGEPAGTETAGTETAGTETAGTETAMAGAETGTAQQAPETAGAADTRPEETAGTTTPQQSEATQPPAAQTATTTRRQREEGMVDMILGYLTNPMVLGGLGALLLLVLGGVIVSRRRAARAEETRSGADWVTAEEDETAEEMDAFDADDNAPPLEEEGDRSASEEDDGGMLETTMISRSPLDEEAESPAGESDDQDVGTATQSGMPESTLVGGTGVDLDENDPLSEADFHMAYGLYDQAADSLKQAIGKDPQNHALRHKLLEVYFTAGNREDFVATAHELHQQLGGQPDADWQNVAIMGKQIAPDEDLFKEGSSTVGTDSSVDLDIGGDFGADFGGGEPAADSGQDEGEISFELPEEDVPAPQASEPGQEEKSDEGAIEFDLGDLDTGTASQSGAEESESGGTDSQADFDKALEELSSSTVGTASMVGDDEPSETAEVDTKLDLARAYIDMGDPDGARSILEEVMEDGNDNQKQQAQELLGQLG